MQFIWAGERETKNRELHFTLELKGAADAILLAAADFYRVFLDGKFVSYGPNRTAAGYARPRRIPLNGAKKIEVVVSSYHVSCYCCDRQLPYFGAQVLNEGRVVAGSEDFSCFHSDERREDVPRYTFQRGFVEVYDMRAVKITPLVPYRVEAPVLLKEAPDLSDYTLERFAPKGEAGPVFDEVITPMWEQHPALHTPEGYFSVPKDFLGEVREGYAVFDYALPCSEAGFLKLSVRARSEVRIFAVFDEFLPNGKWVFGRSSCYDLISWALPAGERDVTAAEPYVMKYLRLFVKGDADICPEFICQRRKGAFLTRPKTQDEKCRAVLAATEKTFRHNAVDIFTDCPGRERAGWLCDSYFTGKAEYYFTGKNEVEHDFLENYILAETEELEAGMLPECFPAQFNDHGFIPNWAMWFVIELFEYVQRTGDGELAEKAKKKVMALLDWFRGFENEFGLLEDLRGWVFLEWSVANDAEYVKGVNFPSNMLYALMLERAAGLYGDSALQEKAERIRKEVQRLSFDGEFYCDNAVRKGNALVRCAGHKSETCQYYALFCGQPAPNSFKKKMAEAFGPFRPEGSYPEVGRSNAFIGNFLRFFWLCEEGEYARVLSEAVDYFYAMASKTGTLWENDAPSASCDHGFASAAAVLINECLNGLSQQK